MKKNIDRYPDPDKKRSAPGSRDKTDRNRSLPGETVRNKPDSEISRPEDDEPSGELRRSVTNSDQQNQVTNAESGEAPLDEKETEGV